MSNKNMMEKKTDPSLNREFYSHSFGKISHCNWFWQNYYSALCWQKQHSINYWKSRSLALEFENAMLHQYLYEHNDASTIPLDITTSKNTKKNKMGNEFQKHKLESESSCNLKESEETEKFEFEVTEDVMEFLAQSMRHKLELRKHREEERRKNHMEEGSDDDSCLPVREDLDLLRVQEMKLLYGEAAPKIMAMEAAMQQSVDRFCDLYQPQLWPVVPLK